jgi:Ras GTPase-activating-like protein IQGAP2/3
MRTGKISSIPKDVSFREAIENYYPETRTDYINSTKSGHISEAELNFPSDLQRLRHLADEFLQVILSSAARLPYGIRYIAHETLTTFQVSFNS